MIGAHATVSQDSQSGVVTFTFTNVEPVAKCGRCSGDMPVADCGPFCLACSVALAFMEAHGLIDCPFRAAFRGSGGGARD